MADVAKRLREAANGADLVGTIRNIFEEFPASQAQSGRSKVFEFAIQALETEGVSKEEGKQMVAILLREADFLSVLAAARLGHQIMDNLKKGKVVKGRSLELFPKLLSTVGAGEVDHYGDGAQLDGDRKRRELIDCLCAVKWPLSLACSIVTMCRDLKLSDGELWKVIDKSFQVMKAMPPAELPPVIYQLLTLSTKGHKRLVLTGVVRLFNELDRMTTGNDSPSDSDITVATSSSELLQMEGTVMLHILFAIKQDQDIGKELLEAVKANLSTLSCSLLSAFCVSLLLSVAHIERLQEQICSLLRTAVVTSIKDGERWRACRWIQDLVPDGVVDMHSLLMQVVQNSSHGWDYVLEGTVQFGFSLMEGYSPRSVTSTAPFGDLGSVERMVCDTGAKVVLKTYEVHRIARKEIVKQLLQKINTSASGYAMHYISTLYTIVRRPDTRETLLESVSMIEKVLVNIVYFPVRTAEAFMEAIQPLLRHSVALKESLLVILRKTLFSSMVSGRCIAVQGYLMLLRNFRILDEALLSSQSSQPLTGSQVFVELHGQNQSASNEALCLEILGTLRRCLSQQVEVRRVLYEGFYDVFCANTNLQAAILDFLLLHLKELCTDSLEEVPPFDFSKCCRATSGLCVIVEPLDALIGCLVRCYGRYMEDEHQEVCPAALRVCDHLKSLARQMAQLEPEDIDVRKDADFSSTSTDGSRHLCTVSLAVRCCEMLMEFVYLAGECTQASCDQILQLFKVNQKLNQTVQESASGLAGTKRPSSKLPPTVQSLLQSCMTTTGVKSVLKGLSSDTLPAHQPGLAVLRKSVPFCKHMLSSSLLLLSAAVDAGRWEGEGGTSREKDVADMVNVFGRCYVKQLELACLPGHAREDSSRGKSVAALCVDGLVTVVGLSCHLGESWREAMLNGVVSSSEGSEQQADTAALVKKFQRLVNGVISEPPDILALTVRDAMSLLPVITQLSALLEEDKQVDVLRWAHGVCKEQSRDDVVVCKGFLTSLFSLYRQCDVGLKLIRKVCNDVHTLIGDVDEDVLLVPKHNLSIVTARNVSSCTAGLLLSHIDLAIDDTEWLVVKLKGDSSVEYTVDVMDSLCENRLDVVIQSCNELVQTGVSPGPLADTIVKLVTRVYNLLRDVTKQMLDLLKAECGSELPPAYVNTTNHSGTHLGPQVYAFIHYLQMAQSQMGPPPGKKGKGKAGTGNSRAVQKEVRFIPQLIFAIEDYEKFLVRVSKKAKVDLMKNFKRSTARDFKINSATVTAKLAEEMEDDSLELLKDDESAQGDENLPS